MAYPTLVSEIDWTGYPSAGYFDQLRYADGLVSYWRLNSGSTLVDELGTNTGTMNGSPPTTTGALPNDSDLAVSFDGSTDDGVVNDTGSLTPPNFTLEGWVRVESLPGATRDLVAKRGSYLLQMNSSGKLLFLLKNDTTVTTVQSGAGLSTGSWYHVACVYDGSTVKIYINGILDQSTSHTVGLGLSLQPLRFAATPSTAVPTWQSATTASSGGVVSASITANKPASTASGDLLFAQVEHRNDALTITPPSGWTLIRSDSIITGDNRRVALYFRVAGGSEPASYTWTLSGSAFWVVAISRITGADTSFPIVDAYSVLTASGTSHSTGTHLGSVDNNMVLALFAGANGTQTWTESSGTERYDAADGNGVGNAIAMSSQTQATASSLSVTGTSSGSVLGYAALVVIAGAGLNRVACKLDDFTLWNRALTADEVVQHYQARLGGVGTWVDVTSDIAKVDTKIGRQYELDRFQGGGATAYLENLTRAYDPANTGSAYAPNVLPLRKIRHRADLSSVKYGLSRGFIEGLPSDYEGDLESLTITSTDAFEFLNLAPISGSLAAGLAGAQIHTLLDQAGWPRADRAIDTGQFTMAAIAALSGTALPTIQLIAESELGIFFIDDDGIATFHDYAHRWTNSQSITSQATFSNAADSFIPYVPELLKPSLDKERIVNFWMVTSADGTVKTASDALSRSKYGPRSGSRSTQLDDPNDAQTIATALLQQTANPARRYGALAVEPIDDSSIWTTVLGLGISDRITVIQAPAAVAGGPTITKDFFIEGIAWSAPVGEMWRVTFQLSPCSPAAYYDLILRDVPVSYWRMDTTT